MQDERGYCFITANQPGGITPILTNDSLSRNFYIPEIFPELELYIERTNAADTNATVSSPTSITARAINTSKLLLFCSSQISFSASFISEDESILSHPIANRPLTGLLHSQRSCKSIIHTHKIFHDSYEN